MFIPEGTFLNELLVIQQVWLYLIPWKTVSFREFVLVHSFTAIIWECSSYCSLDWIIIFKTLLIWKEKYGALF